MNKYLKHYLRNRNITFEQQDENYDYLIGPTEYELKYIDFNKIPSVIFWGLVSFNCLDVTEFNNNVLNIHINNIKPIDIDIMFQYPKCDDDYYDYIINLLLQSDTFLKKIDKNSVAHLLTYTKNFNYVFKTLHPKSKTVFLDKNFKYSDYANFIENCIDNQNAKNTILKLRPEFDINNPKVLFDYLSKTTNKDEIINRIINDKKMMKGMERESFGYLISFHSNPMTVMDKLFELGLL